MPRTRNENPNKRVVPYNTEAEMYVLGSIIIDNKIMHAVSGKLVENDFYDEQNAIIYRAISSLYNHDQAIEPLSIIDEMRRLKIELPDDAKEYILELVDNVPSTSSVNLYVDLVKEKAIERELLNHMKEISDDILVGNLDFNGILDKAEDKIQAIVKKRRTTELLTMSRAVDQVYENIRSYSADKNDIRGIPSGFKRLDKATLGFQKGNLVILAARPSVGKSAFALNIAVNACRKNPALNIAFFSLEMTIEQLLIRLFSYESKVSMRNILNGNLEPKEMVLLGHACKTLKMHNIYFDESNSSDIYDIRSKCRQLKQTNGLDMIIIDYLQLISATSQGGRNRQEEVAKISRELKILAKELEVPVIALSQLSRKSDEREDKKPVLSDLRESGGIEQDADIVMFLYRNESKKDKDEYKDEIVTVEQENEESGEKAVELTIAKNRQGALRDITYNFAGEICTFQETKFIIQKTKKEKSN